MSSRLRLGAGGEQQLVVAHGRAVAQMHTAGLTVHGGDGLAEVQLDLGLRVPGRFVDEDGVALLLAGEIALRQWRTFVGVVALVADEDHPAGEPFRPQGFRGFRRRQTSTDNDECAMCVDHLMPPRCAAAICERPARSVMAIEGALRARA